jgi:ectoine hydroxylase-related dioxygenase (phytanoyl-CoA dioxygenase family)
VPNRTIVMRSSNGVPIEFDHRHVAPMRDSTPLLADPARLRERYREDGYLLLRGVLDAGRVWRLRAAYFSAFPDEYFRPGTSRAAGVYSGHAPAGLRPYGVAGHPAHDFVRGTAFAEFTAQARLEELARTLLGGPVRLLPRQVLRHFDASSKESTRAHVDRAYPSGAESDLVTAWIPLGDCPVETGGLVYLEGSHRLGAGAVDRRRTVTDRPHDSRPFSHDLAWTARTLGGRWLWTNFRAGDLAMHCPEIVHASLDTATETMRLSADIRFQSAGLPVRREWTRHWSADDGA